MSDANREAARHDALRHALWEIENLHPRHSGADIPTVDEGPGIAQRAIEADDIAARAVATPQGARHEAASPVSTGADAKDAARYRWLRDHRCNSLHLERDADHACNYMTAAQWIEKHLEDFEGSDIQAMKDANTIWSLQIYPNTPVGFNLTYGPTMDSVLDAAMSDEAGKV